MKGRRLEKGATIGIVAPASCSSKEKVLEAKKNIEEMGFNVVLGQSTLKKWHSFSDTDENRAKDINEFFKNPSIDAIMCMRGGYGSNRLVEYLDLEVIRNNPKIFIGYSDITTLHMIFNEKLGLITFHGPMAVSNFLDGYSSETYKSFIKNVTATSSYELNNFGKKLEVINSGKAKGKLVGGNLTTLVSTLGTKYDIDYKDKILFLEEIGEKTYRIDRLLNHLKKYGVFSKINGLILGDFKKCDKSSSEDMTLEEVFNDYLKNLTIPVIKNIQSGHCDPMVTLPLGVMCEIDGEISKIKILEGVVE